MPFENDFRATDRRTNQYSLPDKDRCRYTNNRGDRCDYRAFDPATGLCVIHERRVTQKMEARAHKRADRLFEQAGKLKRRDQIHPFLVNLMRLMVEGEFDRHDVAVLAYTCSLVLQTLPSRNAKPPEKKVEIIWDLLTDPAAEPPASTADAKEGSS